MRHMSTSPAPQVEFLRIRPSSKAYLCYSGRKHPLVAALIFNTSRAVGSGDGLAEQPCLISARQSRPQTIGYLEREMSAPINVNWLGCTPHRSSSLHHMPNAFGSVVCSGAFNPRSARKRASRSPSWRSILPAVVAANFRASSHAATILR